jgi:hypothetical protein
MSPRKSGRQSARHDSKPATGLAEDIRAQHILHIPVRKVALALLPEPVDVSRAIGRPPLEWETLEIIEARRRERRAELVLFRGLM